MRRDIVPGVLDAALSSLATFVTGLYAARYLPPTSLGGYALVFSAFMLMTKVPAQLMFRPAEIEIVSYAPRARLQYLWQTLILGTGPVVLSALMISCWVFVAPSTIPSGVLIGLTCTAVLAAIVSPVQDHVRRMLHMADGSWYAAIVSGVQVVGAVAAVAVLAGLDLPSAYVPFGGLGVANLLSLMTGLMLARRSNEPIAERRLRFRDLAKSGRWLLLIGLMPLAAAFAAGILVSHLAGAAALGYAEAARVLGQPPFVLSVGLGAVLGPRSIQAARLGHFTQARRVSRVYTLVTLVCGLPYLALVGFAWEWNPAHQLLPNAYAISGLVAATILGNMLIGMDWPYRSELLGAGRATTLAKLEGTANIARTTIATTAGVTGAFAIPAGLVTLAAVRSLGYRVALRSVWEEHRARLKPKCDRT